MYQILGKSRCSSVCISDFDCRWGQVCEYGICAKNAEIHWQCYGAFNDPHESCARHAKRQGMYITCGSSNHNEVTCLSFCKPLQSQLQS